jgi:hypothetical protein
MHVFDDMILIFHELIVGERNLDSIETLKEQNKYGRYEQITKEHISYLIAESM